MFKRLDLYSKAKVNIRVTLPYRWSGLEWLGRMVWLFTDMWWWRTYTCTDMCEWPRGRLLYSRGWRVV